MCWWLRTIVCVVFFSLSTLQTHTCTHTSKLHSRTHHSHRIMNPSHMMQKSHRQSCCSIHQVLIHLHTHTHIHTPSPYTHTTYPHPLLSSNYSPHAHCTHAHTGSALLVLHVNWVPDAGLVTCCWTSWLVEVCRVWSCVDMWALYVCICVSVCVCVWTVNTWNCEYMLTCVDMRVRVWLCRSVCGYVVHV